MGQAAWKGLVLALFDYKTAKFVVAKSKKVGVLYRLLQLSVLLYLIIWVFGIKKSYQDTDTSLQSAVVTKVKGVAFTNTTLLGERLWDVADFVIPFQGNNAFIVITNLILTLNQRQGTCAEHEGIPDGKCSQDNDCLAGETVTAGHGLKTGRCLRVGNSTTGTCEIFAWCPVERRIKLTDNVLETTNKTYLKTCHFSPKNLYCPIFRLGTIISWAGTNFQDIALKGGVIGIYIEWDCDLDKAASNCNPRYYFNRLDNKHSKSLSSGYNFRFARYYRDHNGKEYRDLIKAYGIRFDVIVYGKAGKFSIIPTVINLGTGFALMGAGAFLCDLILIYLIRKRGFYRDKKFEKVSGHKAETQEAKFDVKSKDLDQDLQDEPPEGNSVGEAAPLQEQPQAL
ncbi:P2X purinoceptor 5 isoform X2 [Nannospalax galili]|uniref:P2X purinoceptor 5 isoform X2 n=1 Tax=Nannospalax galili TaxID=1026970 RepID=UPI00111C5D4E|nr:P2X purinoceptor 5 isoform X2 [Nannospalax galili]